MPTDQTQNLTLRKFVSNQKGFILIAALTLLTILTLLGTTAYILSSTDIKVGGNFRDSQLALQVAMAGAEKARAQLTTELFPVSGLIVSLSEELAAKRGANNVLNGYASGTDDVALANGSLNRSNYVAYLTNDKLEDATDPYGGQYLTNDPDNNSKVLITSVATGPNSASARVEMVVYSPAGLAASPATVYSKGDVTGNGSSLTISGNDACGATTSKGVIFTKDPATTDLNGHPNLSGSPSTPQHGSTNFDVVDYVDKLKAGATTTLTADQNGPTYGSPTNYVTVYSDTNNPPNNQGLKLQNVTGYGILLVTGDLELGGGFQWNGIIITTGSVTLNGGGSGINIQGLIFTGTSTLTDITINGGNVIGYDSCKVKKALNGAGVRTVNWKQVY
jgi:Tfp pilus assembly protein PilX